MRGNSVEMSSSGPSVARPVLRLQRQWYRKGALVVAIALPSVGRADDVSLCVDDAILEVRLRHHTVPEAEQFTGSRVDLGMRGEGMCQLAIKRVQPESV